MLIRYQQQKIVSEMENNYRVEKVDTLIYTDEDWKRYFDFRTKSFALKSEPMPFDSWEELKAINIKSLKESGDYTFMVWKNGKENRTVIFSTMFKDDLERRFTYLMTKKDEENLEAGLLEKMFREYIDFDTTSNSLAIYSKNGMNDFVEDLYGAKLGSISELYELNIKDANIEKIDSWLAEAPAKFPNLRIAFYDEIPDDLLEEYAAMFTQMHEDMPANSFIDDMTVTAASIKARQEIFKQINYSIYNYLIFNEANQIIAKTHVSLKRKLPQVMYQHMTGVKESYRGRGLSKWLKAAMYKKLIKDFPELEKITTDTHPENHPSRELSKQMGYKRIGTAKEFLIERADIVEYLDANA